MSVSFRSLGLSTALCDALSELGFEEPTPIQAAAVPSLLSGRDVLGQAATGTGKTAAFALPMIERWAAGTVPELPRVLVLTPTRELCLQVAEAFMTLGRPYDLQAAPIYGGQEYGRQIRLLKRGVHVVVATPGRALDHIARGTLDLSGIRALVLDEADEMLDMGFADELDAILSQLPRQRQTALFSATLPARIRGIAASHLTAPEEIVIARETPASGEAPRVPQTAYVVGRAQKPAALGRLLDVADLSLAIVFARTRGEVDEVTESLRSRGFAAEALHGGLDQPSRDRVMQRARNGALDVIVATDVAARGIDLDNVSHVINYGIPDSLESYVHRIGRTGRAGRSGIAMTILEPRERRQLRAIEGMVKCKIALAPVPSAEEVRTRRLLALKEQIREVLSEESSPEFRLLVQELAEEFDIFDVAAAASLLAHRLSGAPDDEEDIPEFQPREPREPRRREDRPSRGMPAEVESGMTRLFIGIGRSAGIRPGDIVGAIAGEAQVSSRAIGAIDIAERFTLAEVDASAADHIIESLQGAKLRGRTVQVRRDRPQKAPRREPRASRFDDNFQE